MYPYGIKMWNKSFLPMRVGAACLSIGLLFAGAAGRCFGADAASVAPSPTVSEVPAPTADMRRQGALYRVRRGVQTSYLFGTVHVGSTSFYPLAPAVRRALADAQRLVLELDTRANDAFQQAVARHASYGQGDDIRQHIAPTTLTSLTTALQAAGIPLANVAHLKPWLLANLLLGMDLQRHGFERHFGVEAILLADAQEHGRTVTELESAEYQLALFDTLGDAGAERYLLEALRGLADGSALSKSRALLDAWNSGDTRLLDALLPDATGGDTLTSEFTRTTLLGRRNPEMAERIDHIMQEGTTAFVGVGLLHLLGANGVPQLLAQRGYQVERVY